MISELNTKFDKIEFEPAGHTYTVEGENLTPVSNMISQFYEEFNTEEKAFEYAMRHGGDPIEIAEEWREKGRVACDFGTKVHQFGEDYFNDKSLVPSNGHEEAVVSFWNTIPDYIIPLHSELMVYSERLQFAGTIDNLFFDGRNGGLIISDYKTNKDLFKNFKGKKMLPPFNFLYDMPLSKYELQLSMYQIPLEELGLKVTNRWIVWLRPDGTFERFEGGDYSKKIEMELLKAV